MSDVEEEIRFLLDNNPGLSDKELAEAIRGHGASPPYINQTCRTLEMQGVLRREKRKDGLIGNWLKDKSEANKLNLRDEMERKAEDISEKKIKQVLENHLIKYGWEPKIAWYINGHNVDIEAKRNTERWIIQVKGSSFLHSVQINNFISVLGEILQRMDDPDCKYSIALPDLEPFHKFWERLPGLAKSRLQTTALFVNFEGDVHEDV
jgi:hypothetical protein